MNEIKNHSNPKYFVIYNPSLVLVAEAKKLTVGNWAKITDSGNIICHVNYRAKMETLAASENRKNAVVVIDLMDQDACEKFADNFNKHAAGERFELLALQYSKVVRFGGSCKAAEEMAAKIQAGITVDDLETWLI